MRKHFTYNFIKKTIIGSKAAINRANKGMNPEYTELTEMLAKYPNFSVEVKSPKKKEGKKTYSKLTFERMEEYIRTKFVDKETLEAKLIEFKAIQKIAELKGAKYPLTKKWFLATYEEYKLNEVSEQERADASETEKKAQEEAEAKVAEAKMKAMKEAAAQLKAFVKETETAQTEEAA